MENDRRGVALDWNDDLLAGSIIERFELVVAAFGHRVAVRDHGREITYADLDRYANRIARHASSRGLAAGGGPPLALLIPQSIDLIAAEIASLKLGRPFIPLNGANPVARTNEILSAAGAEAVLVCGVAGGDQGPELSARVCDISGCADAGAGEEALDRPRGGDEIAYIIYTSGSTGTPKGVPQSHRHVLHNTMVHTQAFEITEADRQTLLYPPHVYGSVRDTFNALLNGASLHLLSIQTEELVSLHGWLRSERITIYCSVATIFRRLVDWMDPGSPLDSVRIVKLGGEIVYKLDVENFQKHFPGSCRMSCGLASTETGAVSQYFIRGDGRLDGDVATLGTPVPGKALTIVGEDGETLGVGGVGELIVTSRYIAREYWGAPDLTRERFTVDPASGQTVYRTGDLAERRGDGTLVHRGRKDLMVKVRGNRIEIPEIEQALLATGDVKDVVVAAKQDHLGESALVAYVERGQKGAALDTQALRRKLQDRLPAYMVPSRYVVLDRFPLLPNGKKDRRALPDLERPARERAPIGAGKDAATLRLVLDAARQHLGAAEIAVDTNFFDAGATSLKLLDIFRSLAAAVEAPFTLVDFYRFPTIRLFAAHLDRLLNPAAEAAAAPARGEPPAGNRREPGNGGGGVAIVGIACRYPGCESPAQLWEHLIAGAPLLSEVSVEALLARGVPEERVRSPAYIRVASENAHIDEVDAPYFRLSAKEAEMLDPQLRVLLECSVEAIEDAGEPAIGRGADVGVFVAVGKGNYYQDHILKNPDYLAQVGERRALLFNDRTYAASLVAYKLDLTGPTAHIEAACSSSLVAIHHAVRSLRAGDCAMALAGGVRVMVPHGVGYEYGEAGFESADGVVRPFDKDANGTIFGSGAGILLLKPLATALEDRNHIYGVIEGTAVTNDGASRAGFTTPSVRGQVAAVRRAHADAGIEPRQISFVEAHGTGTLVGDPIEVQALNEAFEGVPPDFRCPIGSIKSTLGHLSTAAGVTGVIKAALSLREGVLPATLNYRAANPLIAFDRGPFWASGESVPLDRGRRHAGVSSFGLGGTNVHAVLSRGPTPAPDGGEPPAGVHVFPLSAPNRDGLARRARELGQAIAARPELRPQDVAFTLALGRNHGRFRVALTAADLPSLSDGLAAFAGDDAGAAHDDPDVVFMFPGLGAQHIGMMSGLYGSQPRFRDLIDHCAALLAPCLGLDMRIILDPRPEDLRDAEAVLAKPRNGQPILFAFEYCLARLLESHGVKARAYLGHSLGEYVAATLSGVFALEDVLPLIALRGRLMEEAPGGAMCAVDAPEEVVRAAAERFDVFIAAVNAPNQIVVSGLAGRIGGINGHLDRAGFRTKVIQTKHAFHSGQMDAVLDEFRAELRRIPIGRPTTPIISNLSGQPLAEDCCGVDYWCAHLRGTVMFADCVRSAAGADTVFVEVGPNQTLTNFASNILSGEAPIIPLCRHPKNQIDDHRHFKAALGDGWVRGVDLDWDALFPGRAARKVPLPTYPFQRLRHWIEPHRPAVAAAPEAEAEAARPPAPLPDADRDSVKTAVTGVWAQLLGAVDVDDDADFFSLGGDSMVLVQVQRLIGRQFGIKPTLGALYKNSTLNKLSRYVVEMVGEASERGERADA